MALLTDSLSFVKSTCTHNQLPKVHLCLQMYFKVSSCIYIMCVYYINIFIVFFILLFTRYGQETSSVLYTVTNWLRSSHTCCCSNNIGTIFYLYLNALLNSNNITLLNIDWTLIHLRECTHILLVFQSDPSSPVETQGRVIISTHKMTAQLGKRKFTCCTDNIVNCIFLSYDRLRFLSFLSLNYTNTSSENRTFLVTIKCIMFITHFQTMFTPTHKNSCPQNF